MLYVPATGNEKLHLLTCLHWSIGVKPSICACYFHAVSMFDFLFLCWKVYRNTHKTPSVQVVTVSVRGCTSFASASTKENSRETLLSWMSFPSFVPNLHIFLFFGLKTVEDRLYCTILVTLVNSDQKSSKQLIKSLQQTSHCFLLGLLRKIINLKPAYFNIVHSLNKCVEKSPSWNNYLVHRL